MLMEKPAEVKQHTEILKAHRHTQNEKKLCKINVSIKTIFLKRNDIYLVGKS